MNIEAAPFQKALRVERRRAWAGLSQIFQPMRETCAAEFYVGMGEQP